MSDAFGNEKPQDLGASEDAGEAAPEAAPYEEIQAPRVLAGTLPDVEVNVRDLATPFEVQHRLEGARWLSKGLLIIFGATLLLNLFIPLVFLLVTRSADTSAGLLRAYIDFLKETSAFSSTVFGPLLAFVLGYYFNSKRN
jgi:hypothetical protein